ncbi:MAG: hypothetical protein KC442_18230 [Thermomicrobiales bacterium]|nr:hypothetical protein [Thermomicrobiales bacterium]
MRFQRLLRQPDLRSWRPNLYLAVIVVAGRRSTSLRQIIDALMTAWRARGA